MCRMEQKHNDCSCDTGKRGDVRTNNSGQPVDHSGPVLRVGRTTSNTADRKSEACPPESVSQHKSGQRASEASEHIGRARLALRSEAEQRTSLDQLENNRHKFEEAESKAREQRNEYCGAFTV